MAAKAFILGTGAAARPQSDAGYAGGGVTRLYIDAAQCAALIPTVVDQRIGTGGSARRRAGAVRWSQAALRIGRFHNRQYSIPQQPEVGFRRLPRPAGHKDANDWRIAMTRTRRLFISTSAMALAAACALAAVQPADAQQRKSIRWTTSQVGSYGYTVAASMAKIVEAGARRRIHRHRAALYVTDRRHEGGDERRRRDRLHGRHRHDASSCERVGGFKDYKPAKPELVHTWYAYPMESMMATTAKDADKYQVLEGFQRQAGVLHARRLHELAELPAHLQGARLRLQARPDRSQGECRRAGGRHDRRLGRLHHRRALARAVLEGNRNPHGRRGSSIPARTRSRSSRPPASRSSTSIRRARSPRTSAQRRSRACRSCSATTRGPICRKTSSTR